MPIYTSSKAVPYVYLCTNRMTGEFYYGYRHTNKQPSHIDFPQYKTSSRKVHPMFDQFDWIILAEFESPEDAYDHEQLCIHEQWGSPLLLNMSCHHGKARFNRSGKHTEATKDKIKAKRALQTITGDARKKMSAAHMGLTPWNKGKRATKQHRVNQSAAQIGRVMSAESNEKRRLKTLGISKGPVAKCSCLRCKKTVGSNRLNRHKCDYADIV